MLDVISAVTISYATVVPIGVNILLNTLYFVSVAALGYQLTYYNLFYLYRNSKTSPFMRFNQILICFYAALLIYNIFSGCFFHLLRMGRM